MANNLARYSTRGTNIVGAMCSTMLFLSMATSVAGDNRGTLGRDSANLRRHSADTGHMLQLYEAWMVELFCSKARNRAGFGGSEQACTQGVLRGRIRRCSDPIRKQGPGTYFGAAPEGAEFLGIVKDYQECLARDRDGPPNRPTPTGTDNDGGEAIR